MSAIDVVSGDGLVALGLSQALYQELGAAACAADASAKAIDQGSQAGQVAGNSAYPFQPIRFWRPVQVFL